MHVLQSQDDLPKVLLARRDKVDNSVPVVFVAGNDRCATKVEESIHFFPQNNDISFILSTFFYPRQCFSNNSGSPIILERNGA